MALHVFGSSVLPAELPFDIGVAGLLEMTCMPSDRTGRYTDGEMNFANQMYIGGNVRTAAGY